MTKPIGAVMTRSRHISQEKSEERELWHKLVVKVIIWREKSNEAYVSTKKLTLSEWNTYRQKMVKISVTRDKKKLLSDLKSTFQRIKLNGGLEEKENKAGPLVDGRDMV